MYCLLYFYVPNNQVFYSYVLESYSFFFFSQAIQLLRSFPFLYFALLCFTITEIFRDLPKIVVVLVRVVAVALAWFVAPPAHAKQGSKSNSKQLKICPPIPFESELIIYVSNSTPQHTPTNLLFFFLYFALYFCESCSSTPFSALWEE